MKYIVIAAIVFSVVACSKKDNPSPKTQSADIVGTWHLTWEYAFKPNGDTAHSDFHSRSDKRYAGEFNSDGTTLALQPDPNDPDNGRGYYRIIGDTLYFSDHPVPDNAVTNPLGHDPYLWGWHIDKLDSDSMKLSSYDVDYINSETCMVYVK